MDIERIFLVDFPEIPGALQTFLQYISPHYGITLFHYRRSGNSVSGVLMGLRVTEKSSKELDHLIDTINEAQEFSVREISGDERRIFRFFLK